MKQTVAREHGTALGPSEEDHVQEVDKSSSGRRCKKETMRRHTSSVGQVLPSNGDIANTWI